MALGKPRDVVTYPDLEAKNLTPGEGDNAAKRIDGVYFDINETDTNNALAIRQGHGVDFVDNGSTVGECRVTTVPSGLFDAEHNVVIGDGTRVWKTTMTADDDLRFDDNDIVNGAAGPADYSTAGFIDSLVVWSTGSDTVFIMVDNTEIVLTYDAPNALTADDIARSPTVSEVVDTSLTNLENRMDAEHESNGTHSADIIGPNEINEDTAFIEEAWGNIIRYGRFDNWPAGIDSPPEGWELYGAPTSVERESGAGNVRVGNYSVKITTGGGNRGIQYSVPNYADYQGKSITVSCWVKQSAAGSVAIVIDDGVGSTTGDTAPLTGVFAQVKARRDVEAAASELTISIRSTGGSSAGFYLDEFSAYEGDYLKAHLSHPLEIIVADDVIPVNLFFNGDFGHWWDTTANIGHPDQWEAYTAANMANYHTTSPHFGHSCLQITALSGLGEGVCQKIGAISDVRDFLKGKTICFSAWIKKFTAGTDKDYCLQIDDGVGSTKVTFNQDDYADWTRLWVVRTINAVATEVTVSILADEAAIVAGVLVDGCCLNIGSRPMPWVGNMPGIWSPVRYPFFAAGSLSTDNYLDEAWPVPERFYPTRLDVYCLTGPTHALETLYSNFTLFTAAAGAALASTNFAVTILGMAAPDADGVGGSATQLPAAANTDVIAEENYMRIYHTEDVGISISSSDVNVILTGYTLALP